MKRTIITVAITLAVLGLVIILCSLAILAYAVQTPEHVRARQTVIPTLLTPPVSQP